MGLIVAIIISAFFGALLYHLAGKKGYNQQFWLAMGILLGPFALPFIVFRKSRHVDNKE